LAITWGKGKGKGRRRRGETLKTEYPISNKEYPRVNERHCRGEGKGKGEN